MVVASLPPRTGIPVVPDGGAPVALRPPPAPGERSASRARVPARNRGKASSMMKARAVFRQPRFVKRGAIALVQLESVAGVFLPERDHHAVAGHFGDDRGRRRRSRSPAPRRLRW